MSAIPDEAVEAAKRARMDAMCRYTVVQGVNDQRVDDLTVRDMLSAALPHLQRQWAEELVAEIRENGARDANLDEGFGGDLHECIVDRTGSWSPEFWEGKPQKVAEGVADYVADLLGLDGEETG